MQGKIDFVIMWVDSNDPDWRAEKNKYAPRAEDDDSVRRYRDWDNLRYWFRGVEKYAPWVNKIYFITCGHVPVWLNIRHPKLVVVRHDDYIPQEYLPVFNSSVIEIMINRIEGLSEQFVLFNDDTFLIKPTKEEDFFIGGKPCDSACLNIHSVVLGKTDIYASLQATGLINKYFDMHMTILRNWKKWFNPIYGTAMLRTLYLLPCKVFPEIRQFHLPNSFLKTTFEDVWNKEPELFYETCTHRFRNRVDYTQWSMRNWQIASGNFMPRPVSIGKEFTVGNKSKTIEQCIKYIRKSKGKMICINDGEMNDKEFNKAKNQLLNEFERLLPERSSYENR